MANILEIKKPRYAAWEEYRHFPPPYIQLKIAFHFEMNLQDLLTKKLRNVVYPMKRMNAKLI